MMAKIMEIDLDENKQDNHLMNEVDLLKLALQQEKEAKEKAEYILETRASHLVKINQRLQDQYVKASKINQEFEFLLKITKFETESENENMKGLFSDFLEVSSMLIWAEASFCFKCSQKEKKFYPLSLFFINSDTNNREKFEDEFLKENFCFLEEKIKQNETLRISDFQEEIEKINKRYANLNFGYLFPLIIDQDEKYIFLFTFTKEMDFSNETIELMERGLFHLKGVLQKIKAKKLLLENYKKLKEVKTQLIQSEKMASIGTISAGIAHEINNPLSFLLTNSEVLKEYLLVIFDYLKKLENGEQNTEAMSLMKKNIEYILSDTPQLMSESLEGISRIREIVSGLRTFSRMDEGEVKEFDVNQCIETSLKLVSNELKHKCKIVKNLNNLSKIVGSDGQMIQVFTNILVNSAQAIEGFGVVDINTFEADDQIHISFSDNGKGIDPENLKQLFTPFFTTKPTGQGTGLGLSISYGIIKKHKGIIAVESELGVGTTFFITLPVKRSE